MGCTIQKQVKKKITEERQLPVTEKSMCKDRDKSVELPLFEISSYQKFDAEKEKVDCSTEIPSLFDNFE